MIQSIDLINGYEITQLSKQDNDIVEELCNKCSDYYVLSGGALPSKDDVSELFTDLPPNKNLEDKFLLGVYKSNKLIGIIIHEALMRWARPLGAKRFSI